MQRDTLLFYLTLPNLQASCNFLLLCGTSFTIKVIIRVAQRLIVPALDPDCLSSDLNFSPEQQGDRGQVI